MRSRICAPLLRAFMSEKKSRDESLRKSARSFGWRRFEGAAMARARVPASKELHGERVKVVDILQVGSCAREHTQARGASQATQCFMGTRRGCVGRRVARVGSYYMLSRRLEALPEADLVCMGMRRSRRWARNIMAQARYSVPSRTAML